MKFCGLRYYDSAAGRWLNRDPISYAGGVNVYEYCGNGPVGMSDASGLEEGGGEEHDGPGMGKGGILFGCLSTIWALSKQGTCATLKSSVCHLVVDCLAAAGGLLADCAPLAGCIAGIAIGLLQTIMDRFCDQFSNCPAKWLSVCRMLVEMALGCIAGLDPVLGIFIGVGDIKFGLDDFLNELCKKFAPPILGINPPVE